MNGCQPTQNSPMLLRTHSTGPPSKKYQLVLADPPWSYAWGKGKRGGQFAPERHYDTMAVDVPEIEAVSSDPGCQTGPEKGA
ncbi:MAG: hypothetical protein A3H28_03035 [Acidobacteria bacterium RIFCSPLOWO2_02_FULL_61_28]|nr:MAG: hypothetical protein A3H28_03035 [Acidobacteria bacterium RIFCSPLOWO2_02_FULL_61_28]